MTSTSPTQSPLRLELGAVTRIVLDRPDKQNAMTAQMGLEMANAVERINAAAEPRVVLVTGAGRAFCAGGDLDLIEGNSRKSAQQNRREMVAFYQSYLSVARLRVPSIAVLHGAAIGAGLCLAMACDLRLAATDAKLGANFVRVGLHPGMGCTVLLPRLVGPTLARELILTGALISGERAAEIGLVNRAVPSAELAALVDDTVQRITSAAPIAVAQAKQTLSAPLLEALDAGLEREAECQAIDFATADLREAVAAFRERRAPLFRGE